MPGGYIFPVLGGGPITSDFGSRSAPTAGASTNHGGIDIGGSIGTPILSTIGGNVIFSGNAGAAGNMVRVQGNDGYIYEYMHMQNLGVVKGQTVGAGAQLGTLGATGRVTGPHLHFGVVDPATNTKINPSRILGGAKDKIQSAARIIDDITEIGKAIPGVGSAIGGIGDAIGGLFGGGGGSEESCLLNPFCYLRKWFEESGFIQRIALAALALIFILGAVYMLKSNVVQDTLKKVTA